MRRRDFLQALVGGTVAALFGVAPRQLASSLNIVCFDEPAVAKGIQLPPMVERARLRSLGVDWFEEACRRNWGKP